jgi:hypothetical protein
MALPECFCWSRFGTEAGQLAGQILERKEQERVANGGIFFWGIGNAIGPSMKELLRRTEDPEVLFSSIKSPPRAEDKRPLAVVAWTRAETLAGETFALPVWSLVTSKHDPLTPRETHYALVCLSESPVALSRSGEQIVFSGLRNLLTGRPVAASQVTAVVEHKVTHSSAARAYDVAMRAKLVWPYLLRLRNPVLLSKPRMTLDWASVVHGLWKRRMSGGPRKSEAPRGKLLAG